MPVPQRPLALCLEQLGPLQTPSGTVRWSREFPMGPNTLAFAAELERHENRLVARVRESHLGEAVEPSRDIFQASWVVDQGAWCFDAACLDGKGVAEQSAIATFQDYLNALDVEPVLEATRRRPRP